MAIEHRDERAGIEELQAILPGRSAITERDGGYEITIQSAMDEALTFFVTFPKSKLDAPRAKPAVTEPEEPA